MAFSEYTGYSIAQLETIFNIQTSGNKYPEIQNTIDDIKSRLVLNEDTNEATRSNLLVTPVILCACIIKDIGAFFEPSIFTASISLLPVYMRV